MKKCNKCLQLLDYSCFSPSGGGKYLRPECKKCANKLCKERKTLRDKHGKPPEEYICPICLKDKHDLKGIGGRANTPWAIDHKHHTINLRFRGFLCHNCNRAIGNFNEDIQRLYRAIDYLQKFEDKEQCEKESINPDQI